MDILTQLQVWRNEISHLRQMANVAEETRDPYVFIDIRKKLFEIERDMTIVRGELADHTLPAETIVDASSALRRQLGNADDGQPEDLRSQDQRTTE